MSVRFSRVQCSRGDDVKVPLISGDVTGEGASFSAAIARVSKYCCMHDESRRRRPRRLS